MNPRKRTRKALTINSETLRTLASADIAGVMGGNGQPQSGEKTCGNMTCDPNQCHTLAKTCDDSCPPSRCKGFCD
jgi:hypothetical protein